MAVAIRGDRRSQHAVGLHSFNPHHLVVSRAAKGRNLLYGLEEELEDYRRSPFRVTEDRNRYQPITPSRAVQLTVALRGD